MSRWAMESTGLPKANGHYSLASRHGDVIYLSGQLPVAFGEQPDPSLGFDQQAQLAVNNLITIAARLGANPQDFLRVTAYIVGAENWEVFNRVYAEAMGQAKPARTVVPVPELHFGLLVEVEGIVVLPTS